MNNQRLLMLIVAVFIGLYGIAQATSIRNNTGLTFANVSLEPQDLTQHSITFITGAQRQLLPHSTISNAYRPPNPAVAYDLYLKPANENDNKIFQGLHVHINSEIIIDPTATGFRIMYRMNPGDPLTTVEPI